MTAHTTLQTATGGSPLVVTLTLLALLLTALLSLVVAVLVIRGYRRNRDPGRLYLALGLLLLTAGPIALQFVLSNLTTVSLGVRSAAANASKLLGLVAMLYAIYGVTGRGASSPPDDDGPPADPGSDDPARDTTEDPDP